MESHSSVAKFEGNSQEEGDYSDILHAEFTAELCLKIFNRSSILANDENIIYVNENPDSLLLFVIQTHVELGNLESKQLEIVRQA